MKLNDYDSIIYLTPLGELTSRYYINRSELLEQLQTAGRAPQVVTWAKAKEIHVQLQIVGLVDKCLPIQVHDLDDDNREVLIDIELEPITPPSNIPMDEQGHKDWYLR